jgi:hypothetical protein
MRFTVRRMMTVVVAVAILLFVYRTLGRAGFHVGLGGLLIAAFCHYCARSRPRWAAWGFWSSAIAINLLVATLDVYALCLPGMILMALGSFAGITLTLGLGSAWAAAIDRGDAIGRRNSVVAWSLVISMSIAPTTMATDSWPLKVACLLSRPAMDRLADRVSAGEPMAWPADAGLFTFVGSEFDPVTRCVGLVTNPSPSGRSGFVRYVYGRSSPGDGGPFTNLNFNVDMGGGWRYQDED